MAADWRSGLSGLSAGLLQLMWPDLGRGVQEHSAFFTEPWERIYRSVPQIWATIFAADAHDRGLRIRDLHRDISGTTESGRRYHALEPETFWWAHATFTWEMFQTVDRWDHRIMPTREREQLYQETVTWYRRYGVSDRPVPADHQEFERRFDQICRHELELTPTAERAIDLALHSSSGPPRAPRPVGLAMAGVMRTITLGGLPRVVRDRFGIPWTVADDLRLLGVTMSVRNAGLVIPHRLVRGPYLRSIRRMRRALEAAAA